VSSETRLTGDLVKAAVLLLIDGTEAGTITGIDSTTGTIYYDPFFGGGPRGGIGGGPPYGIECRNCEVVIGKKIQVAGCCNPTDSVTPNCLAEEKEVYRRCVGNDTRNAEKIDICGNKASCARCFCLKRELGPEHCNCMGIV
jgi:hypothetical protein